jgi:hypothetical protein
MAENSWKSVTELFIEKTRAACEKEFGDLLKPESMAEYGDDYPKRLDNAMVRLEGMAAYAEMMLQNEASLMMVLSIFSTWRNRLYGFRDSKENLRVLARSEREIVKHFRDYCRKCVEMASAPADEAETGKSSSRERARGRKEGALAILSELFLMPELHEINDRYAIPSDDQPAVPRPENKVTIALELTEKEAAALMAAERKLRSALENAVPEKQEG